MAAPTKRHTQHYEVPMIRFFTRLFGSRTPAPAKSAPRTILSVETLEAREAPSGFGASQILKQISHAIQSNGIHKEVSHVSLAQALTMTNAVGSRH